MREKKKKLVVTFATTSQAMKMEREAQKAGLQGRLIPVPPVIHAGCGLAFCTEPALRVETEALLTEKQILSEGMREILL